MGLQSPTQGTQYPLVKEDASNHNIKAPIIELILLSLRGIGFSGAAFAASGGDVRGC